MAVITAFALAATCAAALFTWRQIEIARRQAVASEEAAYAACVGTQISRTTLIEAIEQGRVARAASIASTLQTIVATRAESAHIAPYIKGPNPWLSPGSTFQMPFGLKNDGKTAAKNVVTFARVLLVGEKDAAQFVYRLPASLKIVTPLLAAGEEPSSLRASSIPFAEDNGKLHLITQDEYQDLMFNKKRFLILISITYTDTLGIHHWMHFCRTFPIEPSPQDRNVSTGHQDCIEYNREDHNTAAPTVPDRGTTDGKIPEITCPVPSSRRH
ncbi:MAG TPA: hypothetical protein VGE93_15250 [Bryobacteraceae bacterium]|nr:hypothetical protein [Acidobacteriaceae bacterium]